MHLDELDALLGSSPTSPHITEFLTTLSSSSSSSSPSSISTPPPPKPEIKAFPGTIYHNYHDLGVSLCYVPANDKSQVGLKLDEIDIYNTNEDTSSASASGSGSVPGAGAGSGAGNTTGIGGKAGRVPKPTFKTFRGLPIDFPPVVVEKNDATGSTSTSRKGTTFTSASIPTLTSASASTPASPSSPSSPSPSTSTSTSTPNPTLSLNSQTTGRTLVQTLGEPSKKGGGSGIGPFMQGVYLEWARLGVQVDLEAGKGNNKEEGGVWERAAGWGWGCLKVFEKGG